jgi:hypothetical protein
VCGSGSAAGATKCWVCGANLDDASALPPTPLARGSSASSDGHAFRVLGWSAFLLGIGFVTLLVGVELAFEWPGLLIPYALIVLVAFVALARTAYVQLRRRPDPQAAPASGTAAASPPTGKTKTNDIVQDVALGLTIALAVIAGLMLLFVAAVVIFFLICLAIVGAAGLH